MAPHSRQKRHTTQTHRSGIISSPSTNKNKNQPLFNASLSFVQKARFSTHRLPTNAKELTDISTHLLSGDIFARPRHHPNLFPAPAPPPPPPPPFRLLPPFPLSLRLPVPLLSPPPPPGSDPPPLTAPEVRDGDWTVDKSTDVPLGACSPSGGDPGGAVWSYIPFSHASTLVIFAKSGIRNS